MIIRWAAAVLAFVAAFVLAFGVAAQAAEAPGVVQPYEAPFDVHDIAPIDTE